MAFLNKVCLIGNLGQDPESRTTASGKTVVNVSLATTRKAKGQKENKTEWHNLVFFNRGNYKLADIAETYLRKGTQVYIEGELNTQRWEKEGHKFQKTNVIVNELQMLGSLAQAVNHAEAQPSPANSPAVNVQQAATAPTNLDDFDDDIPF